MKFNLPFGKNKAKSGTDMTVIYITVGLVFILITVMNIYAFRVVYSMGKDYSSLGQLSKDLKADLTQADANLRDMILDDKKTMDLDRHVISYVEKADKKSQQLTQIQSRISLDSNLKKIRSLASETNMEKLPAERQKKLNEFSRTVKNTVSQLEAMDDERSALIGNEIGFISFIYIVLLIANLLAFGGIFFVIFVNERKIKLKERNLNATNANFHAIMQGLDSVLLSFDSTGKIQTWNQNAERYFDVKSADAVEKNIYELAPVFQSYKPFFDKVMYSQQRQYNFHEHMHVNKGPTRVVDMLCVPMISSGAGGKNQKSLLIKMDDVTTFTTDEEHAVRVRGANLIRSGMDNVVKDLTKMGEQAGGLLQGINDIAAAHQISGEIVPYTDYLNNLLAQFGAVPQKYASSLRQFELNKVPLDLNELIMYAIRLCLKTFDSRINVEVSQNESKSWIVADSAALSRALLCLLNNAAEAVTEMRPDGEQGGIISVSVEKIAGDKIVCDKIMRFRHAVKEQPYWVVMISDTGPGIPEDVQSSIYDLFFTTKDPALHKGLGLSVTANIVNEHGGYIDVNSKAGRGCVFKVYLPELAGMSEDSQSEQSFDLKNDDADIVYGQGTVLFVSDDIFMRQLTGRLIGKFGYSVIASDNGFEAVDIYAQDLHGEQSIQCVVMDLGSGLLRNADLVTQIRQLNPQAAVAVLVDSLQSTEANELRELGVTDFIKKPFSLPEFSKTLAQYAPAADGGDGGQNA